jgi:hypothetical protein
MLELEPILGFLNFSEGRPDSRFQRQLNDAYAEIAIRSPETPWLDLRQTLDSALASLKKGGKAAFAEAQQAEAAINLVFDHAIPAYRAHHADLLFHLTDAEFHQPFFLARVFEAVLTQRGPWDETRRIIDASLKQLNDYVGHRPIATLENRRRGELYDHERVRPIPLWLRGAGVAFGPYRELIHRAMDVIETIDPVLLRDAYFDPALLDELAIDPRGYDFSHPADKRPNYCFGEWDPDHIDGKGFYRRFIVRHVTLEGLWLRVQNHGDIARDELLHEAACVLVGTMLMGAGTSGAGPTTHDSTVTLSSLVPKIAKNREVFYAQLIERIGGAHGKRLKKEAEVTRQPFGGVRQALNQHLGQHRALHMQRRHLALFLAELGYASSSRRQIRNIPVASVRMLTDMHVFLSTGQMLVDRGQLAQAADHLAQVEDLLKRAIACGAMIDPWNVLGFQGQFPRFQSLEDSIHDHRVDDLTYVVDSIFNLYARLLREGAAQGAFSPDADLSVNLRKLAEWWDRFATSTVAEIPHVQGAEAVKSAEHVANALAQWRERGTASADLSFWKKHLDRFHSPKAFALVVEALLEKSDFQAAMALLMTWLSHADEVPLEDGDFSFHNLALRWMLALCPLKDQAASTSGNARLAIKFFEYLEVNAEDYWNIPQLDFAGIGIEEGELLDDDEEIDDDEDLDDDEDDEEKSIFAAAYEDVTYKDSADDENEGDVVDYDPNPNPEIGEEAERIETRLKFHSTLAKLWTVATRLVRTSAGEEKKEGQEALRIWLGKARDHFQGMLKFMDSLHEFELFKPSGSYDSLLEFDHQRLTKERLLGVAITTCLDQALSLSALRGVGPSDIRQSKEGPGWEPHILRLERALLRQQPEQARGFLPEFIKKFKDEPLLYRPLHQGGHPRPILRASIAQTILRGLVANLPRQGLLRETLSLLQLARSMEAKQDLPGPRVTEFDRLFQVGLSAVVEAVVDAGQQGVADAETLGATLETIVEPFIEVWVEHCETLRVSTLDAITSDKDWDRLVKFIGDYGHDLFTAKFMALGNLRGILHRGVDAYFEYLKEEADPAKPIKLIDELDIDISRAEAEQIMQFILQVVIENYEHYRDYTSTTTQSDYGENLFQLFDFLRLKADYDRDAWRMKPIVMVHEALARRNGAAAALWRAQVEELTRENADEFLEDLGELQKEHGMRMATIVDRLEERFVRPMALDRLCALVEPAMVEAREFLDTDKPCPLEDELEPFAAHPSGVGLDMPPWIQRLEDELERVKTSKTALANLAENLFQVPKAALDFSKLAEQFKDLATKEEDEPEEPEA